jgi:hypothetical protein
MATTKRKTSKRKTPKKANQSKMDQAVKITKRMFFQQGKETKVILSVLTAYK